MSSDAQPAILREGEIRPEELLGEQAERLAYDIEQLLRHRGEFVSVTCPACGSADGSEAFEKYELRFVECGRCRTIFMTPRPTPAILEEYYSTSQNYRYWNDVIFPASEEVRRERIFLPRAQRLADLCRRVGVRGGSFVEVGAGFGTFCEELAKLGQFDELVAIEPTPGLAETCREKGLRVIESPIEKVDIAAGSVTAIASFETIEHLFAPRQFVEQCSEMLRPGGILLLTCPNGQGFEIMELRELSGSVDNEHLNLFNPDSLLHLVTSCGLGVVEVLTPGDLDAELVRKKALSEEIDMSDRRFLSRVLVEEWERVGGPFQRFLSTNLLSSHLWLAAQKPN
jgi:2-polyprenyl-3-methyl-5-hydroxy-6-metoxy-1,4-benzoquinol methylase